MILAFYSEQSGSGKDTCADVAADYLRTGGLTVVRDAFAWDGKVVCADALGISGTRADKVAEIDRLKLNHGMVYYTRHDDEKRTVTSVGQGGRDFIIGLLGSPGKGNGIRGLDEGFWTRQVILRAAEAQTRGAWTVISDLRFIEEAEAVHGCGGKVVEVVRPHGSLGKHNEQRVPVDHVIHNVGTLQHLAYQVVDYVRELPSGP